MLIFIALQMFLRIMRIAQLHTDLQPCSSIFRFSENKTMTISKIFIDLSCTSVFPLDSYWLTLVGYSPEIPCSLFQAVANTNMPQQ